MVGAAHEIHLCTTCIQQLGLQLESGPPTIASILSKAPVSEESVETESPAIASSPAARSSARKIPDCPTCGSAFADFESSKRFGCAHDYSVWEDLLSPLIVGYHGVDRHTGRRPGSVNPRVDERQAKRRQLDAALRNAVAHEDYTQAAHLRDELRTLDGASDTTLKP